MIYIARTGMPLQRYGDAAHPSEAASSNAEAVDIAGKSNAIASHRFAAVCRPPKRHVR